MVVIIQTISDVEENLRGPRREIGSGDVCVARRFLAGRLRYFPLIGAPLDEILPKDNAAKGGKAVQMKPATRRRIGHAGADGKLLGVQGLIQTALFQDGFKRNALELLVLAFRQNCVSVERFHNGDSLNPTTDNIAENRGVVSLKMALAASLRAFIRLCPSAFSGASGLSAKPFVRSLCFVIELTY